MKLRHCLNCSKIFKRRLGDVGKYCCHRDYEWKVYKEEIKKTGNGNPRGNKNITRSVVKRYLKETRGYKCSICEMERWQGKEIPLIIDHINGNSADNNLNNLRLVCGNCDMQSPTYKNKNQGNGRHSKRLEVLNENS